MATTAFQKVYTKISQITKATCSLVWMRINQETMMAEVVTRTVTCEDNTVLPTVERVCGKHVYHDWKRAEW